MGREASIRHWLASCGKLKRVLRHMFPTWLYPILREFRDGVQQIYGSRLVRVVLFGSQARDDAESDSDIDVMLVLEGAVDPNKEIQRLSPFTSGLSLKHDVVISCVYVSEESFQNEQSPLMLNVRREGVLV